MGGWIVVGIVVIAGLLTVLLLAILVVSMRESRPRSGTPAQPQSGDEVHGYEQDEW